MIERLRGGAIAAPSKRRTRLRNGSLAGLVLVAPAFALMLLLILAPATATLLGTFFPQAGAGPTLDGYRNFLADRQSVSNLLFTLSVTLQSALWLLVLGLVVATYLRFSQSRLVAAIQVLALFPLFVPGIVASFALIRFLGPTGVVATTLKSVGITGWRTPYLHPSGAIIGLVWENLPLTVMLLTAGLSQVSNRAVEAARDVGAGTLRLFVHIVLPQLTRSIAVVCCLNFLSIFGAFTLPYILGPAAPQMMGVFMQRTFSELHRAGEAEVQAAVTFLICLVAGAVYTALVFRDSGRAGTLAR